MKKVALVVEDDVNIAEAERIILKEDFTVHVVHDGESGVREAKRLKPAVIILDVMLPKKSGFEVCKELRADTSLDNSKIIMVTAKDQEKDEALGMDLGADDYLMKPFESVELTHIVRQVLRS